MLLIERSAEIELLGDLLQDCLTERGRVVLVTGAHGMGKTELLHAVAARAHETGTLFLSATCSATEQLPLGVMRQLFESDVPATGTPPDAARRIVEILDEAVATLTGLEPIDPRAPVSTRVLQTLCRAVLNLTTQAPVLIGVDDIDHADIPSLQCLLFLTRRIRLARTLMVLNGSPGSGTPYAGFRSELLGQSHVRRIRLAALSEEGVATLLAGHMDSDTAKRLAAPCHTISGGNPFLVSALLEDHYTSLGDGCSHDLVPREALRHAVTTLVNRWDPAIRRTARALAVVGGPAFPALVGQLVDIGPDAVAEALAVLTATGLLREDQLDEDRIRHPAIRAAILSATPKEVRTELHRRAAEVLRAAGADATAVAAHLLAIDATDLPWAVPVLRAAAEQALVDDDVQAAINYLRRAWNCSADDRQRGAIITSLAGAQWRLDPSAVLPEASQLAPALRAGQRWGPYAVSLVRYLLWHGHSEAAAAALSMMDTRTSEAADPEVAAEVRIAQLTLSTSYPPLAPRESRTLEAVVGGLPASVSLRLRAAAALATVLTNGVSEAVLHRAEWVLESARLNDTTLEPVAQALQALVYADRLDKAGPWCDSLLAEARSRSATTWQAQFQAIRAEIALRQGDLRAAEEHARTALNTLSPRSWGVAIGAPLGTLVLAAVATGNHEDAEQQLRRRVPEAMYSCRYGLHYIYARGHYHLATRRLHAALDDFETCGKLMGRWGLDRPSLVSWRAGAAETWLALGRTDRARKLIDEQLARSDPAQGRTYGMSLRLLAATSELRRRPQILREAVEAQQNQGDRVELARALTDLSRAHHALGESKLARIRHTRAWQIAKECHAEPLCEALRPGPLAQPPEDPTELAPAMDSIAALSPSERRVAELAALGHTNREIADKLFVTVSTVEQHLTRVYRKLQVKRGDLLSGLEFPKVYSA